MKRRIVFATGNENKMKEIRMILADLGMEIVSMREAGVDEEIVEDGMSFEENAEIKARAVSRVLVNDIVLQMIQVLRLTIWIRHLEFILRDLPERILLMI